MFKGMRGLFGADDKGFCLTLCKCVKWGGISVRVWTMFLSFLGCLFLQVVDAFLVG
jgi:hypothetical protein